MFKVGLKKKKKGKKKKDQELFTEEELEQYKRAHQFDQEIRQEASASTATESTSTATEEHPEKSENDDEWKQFAALTTGIDSILKKTQGDLDRIKETSFFKRVAPKRPEPVAVEEAPKVEEKPPTPEEEKKVKQLLNAVVELSDSEPESDHDVAFETDYIDQELPLAYVEDLEDDQDQGPDPFDTGYAERVIKGPEVSNRGKKIINIGSAVQVLTGKVEVSAAASKQRRARRGIQNLLLESFEVTEEAAAAAAAESEESVAKTLLDEPAELDADAPIDLSVSLHLKLKKSEQGEESVKSPEISDDILKVVEFKVRSTTPKTVVEEEDSTDWAEFEIQRDTKDKPSASPKKSQGASSNLAVLLGEDESEEEEEVDPFDTDYVEKIVPKPIDYDDDFDPREKSPSPEPKEEEEDDFDFDPRAGEEVDIFDTSRASRVLNSTLLTVEKKDLLSTSQTDITSALAPTADIIDTEEEIDPFDTSAVDAIVAPGKAELKFLEKELLESDDEFDPRAGEEKPSAEELRRRKSSLSLTLSTPKGGVSFIVPTPDLLKAEEQSGKIQKPLTPYYHRESSLVLEDEIPEEDPFDTSYVSVVPTTIELDILEKEILKQPTTLKQSLSDPDFDPRAITPEPARSAEDLLHASEHHDIKVLTPARGDSIVDDSEVDPFDTSAIAYQPGTVELKLLEDELIEKKPEPVASTDILSDTQDNSIYDKILTPQPTASIDIEADDDIDPFDTSFVSNLQPGETEIKLIENELIN